MKYQSKLRWNITYQVKSGIKLLAIGVIPLVTGLVLGSTLSPTHAVYPSVEEGDHLRSYTIAWDSHSLDETMWFALQRIAYLEEILPQKVARFQVEIQPTDEIRTTVHLAFDRINLERLKTGKLAPEIFIREYVEFN